MQKGFEKKWGIKGERYTFLLCYGMGKSSCKKATTKTWDWKKGVIFHYLIKTENSQGTFCQQRVLIKNASGRLGNVFESHYFKNV